MEIWEIESKWKTELKRKFPKAEVKITDSYKEIRQTSRKFDVVIVDNPYVSGNHYEHFDLFPDIFRVLNDTAVIVLIVIPEIHQNIADEWLKKRHSFYTATNPTNITFDEIEITYRNLATQNGWTIENLFFQSRWNIFNRDTKIHYLVLHLKRQD